MDAALFDRGGAFLYIYTLRERTLGLLNIGFLIFLGTFFFYRCVLQPSLRLRVEYIGMLVCVFVSDAGMYI